MFAGINRIHAIFKCVIEYFLHHKRVHRLFQRAKLIINIRISHNNKKNIYLCLIPLQPTFEQTLKEADIQIVTPSRKS